ncbi:MAG: cytochrome c-type biogenesis protein CcmH [Acidobacteriota bacterium]|nr:cytochrome c-type biogenesis protein CcmH [Acidobacteriota bacterium]
MTARKFFASFGLWVVALIAVVALVVVAQGAPHTRAARVAHLESLVKCPSCEDLSVAQSNATAAVAVRHEIEAKVRAGESDTAILTSLESTYGRAILLSPSTSGLGALLWIGPVLVGVLLVVSGARLWRRRS